MFIQKFEDSDYSVQTSLNTSLAKQGTNNLETQYQDKVCNIWDMASNCGERTTETCINSYVPCTNRGGCYDLNVYTSNRYSYSPANSDAYSAFRPLLYL